VLYLFSRVGFFLSPARFSSPFCNFPNGFRGHGVSQGSNGPAKRSVARPSSDTLRPTPPSNGRKMAAWNGDTPSFMPALSCAWTVSWRLLTEFSSDPACGTCRKKCRKCDRKRPICDRCRTKGLHCEGYPLRFQFCDMITVPRLPNSAGARADSASKPTESPSRSAEAPEALTAGVTTGSPSSPGPSPWAGSPPLTIPSLLSPLSSKSSPVSTVHLETAAPPLIAAPELQDDIVTHQPLIDYCERCI